MIGSRDGCGRSLAFFDPVPTVFVLFPVLLGFNNFFVSSAKEAHLKGRERERRSRVRNAEESAVLIAGLPGGGEDVPRTHHAGKAGKTQTWLL